MHDCSQGKHRWLSEEPKEVIFITIRSGDEDFNFDICLECCQLRRLPVGTVKTASVALA